MNGDQNPLSMLAQGFNSLLSQGNLGIQALINSQSTGVQQFSRMAQQMQSNIVNGLNSTLGSFGVQASKPLVGVQQFTRGGQPPLFSPSQQQQSQEAVAASVSNVNQAAAQTGFTPDFIPMTEGQKPFYPGTVGPGFTESPKLTKTEFKTNFF